MKLTKITPRGFCKGVVDAWNVCKKISIDYPSNPKYMIGWLVHNIEMINEIKKIGFEVLDDVNKSRIDLVKSIPINENNLPIVVFSAHGSPINAINYAKAAGMIVYDTTCYYVEKTHNIIKEQLNLNKTILFIGKQNHPETVGVLSIDNKIILIENELDIINLKIKDKDIFVINQTTISIYEFYKLIKMLKQKFTNIEFKNDICDAAQIRQEAIINMDNSIDLLIVVGDQRSNNSKKLVEIALNKNIESYLVNSIEEINYNWFVNKKHVGISSGCSTPTWITNKIINYIECLIGEMNEQSN